MLTGTLLGAICGEEICGVIGSILGCGCIIPCAGGCGPAGSFLGLEVGGLAGALTGAAVACMAGLCEGLFSCVGGLNVVLGAVTGGLFQICGELINVCNAIL